MYFLGNRRTETETDTVRLSNLKSPRQLEQSTSLFYVNDETDHCDDDILPPKLLTLQLLDAKEGMHAYSQCYICISLGCVDDSRSSDASDVIQSRLNNMSRKTRTPTDTFNMIYESGLKQSPWQAQIEKAVKNEKEDEFLAKVKKKINEKCIYSSLQVAEKTQQMRIGRTDAILEVYTDRIIKKKQNKLDEALLWVTKHAISEFSVCS